MILGFLSLVFTQTHLLRRCSRIGCTVLPNKQSQGNFISSSERQLTMIMLKKRGAVAYQQSHLLRPWKPMESPVTKKRQTKMKTPTSFCWPSLFPRHFMVIWVPNKLHQRWLFPSAFTLLSLIGAVTKSASSAGKCQAVTSYRAGEDAAGLHHQPQPWGQVTPLP